MKTERIVLNSMYPLCYWAELIGASHTADSPMTFAHVLNVPQSEDWWLADATELFVPEFFAKRYLLDDLVYRNRGVVSEHMREELNRQSCSPEQVTLESLWLSKHKLYCYERDGSFADDLFGADLTASFAAQGFCDDSDDEFDTLDSELLLTDVYFGPREVAQALMDSPFSPKRPVGAIPPTEQEE